MLMHAQDCMQLAARQGQPSGVGMPMCQTAAFYALALLLLLSAQPQLGLVACACQPQGLLSQQLLLGNALQ